jgi:hypothetical protein
MVGNSTVLATGLSCALVARNSTTTIPQARIVGSWKIEALYLHGHYQAALYSSSNMGIIIGNPGPWRGRSRAPRPRFPPEGLGRGLVSFFSGRLYPPTTLHCLVKPSMFHRVPEYMPFIDHSGRRAYVEVTDLTRIWWARPSLHLAL